MQRELESISNKLTEVHSVLYREIGPLSEETIQAMVTDQWTVKDVLAHLAGAERGMFRIAQGMARGENPHLPEGYNNDEFNARQVAKRKTQTLAQLLDEVKAIHDEMFAFLNDINAEQLARMGEHPLEGVISLKDLLVVIYNHEMAHCKEIMNALRAAKK